MSELHTTLGKILKAERERQGKALADVSQELKIAEGHLLAIEAGDIGGVPSELYFKLFARSYAESLGLDYAKAVDMIREDINEVDLPPDGAEPERVTGPRPITPRPAARQKNGKMGLWVLAVFGMAIIAAVAWLILSKKDTLVFGGGDSDTTQAVESESDGDSDVVVSSSSRENMALNLDLVARDRTWAVVIADGDTVLQTNLKPWREYYIGAQDTLVVSIGTPLAVELMLNGTTATLTNPEDGSVSGVVITPENIGLYIQRALDDSLSAADMRRDSLAGDSLAPRQDTLSTTGTGSSPATPTTTDTASTRRGTTYGI